MREFWRKTHELRSASNLGVVYFRRGRGGLAEATLRKPFLSAPNDDCVLTAFGIVRYRQSNLDDAQKDWERSPDHPNSAIERQSCSINGG
jgi:Flp pilus assembly protein TadD